MAIGVSDCCDLVRRHHGQAQVGLEVRVVRGPHRRWNCPAAGRPPGSRRIARPEQPPAGPGLATSSANTTIVWAGHPRAVSRSASSPASCAPRSADTPNPVPSDLCLAAPGVSGSGADGSNTAEALLCLFSTTVQVGGQGLAPGFGDPGEMEAIRTHAGVQADAR